ncbi:hypothetical protein HAP48_0005190 [Bradyrhizobium septentrionale]|uniref:Uncharacterized protein n=1 Tax=Bradyrhizobium septentrionale TaxID=1404411 RepID=A0A973W6I0_9BRAD|nr:hypothetical protein [Bradyrhizobium septentrionale]UGY16900.1 hypothetical protein HAP48_0005190 [Bradyrhizobium septentrionale]
MTFARTAASFATARAQLLFLGRDLLVELGDLGLERVDLGLELADLRGLGLGRIGVALQRVELLERGFAVLCLVGAGLPQLLDGFELGRLAEIRSIPDVDNLLEFGELRSWLNATEMQLLRDIVKIENMLPSRRRWALT